MGLSETSGGFWGLGPPTTAHPKPGGGFAPATPRPRPLGRKGASLRTRARWAKVAIRAALATQKYHGRLASTKAGAVNLGPGDRDADTMPRIVADNPYAYYARTVAVFRPAPVATPGNLPFAQVDASANVDAGAEIAAFAVVGAGASLGKGAGVGPHSVVGNT